MTNPDFIERDYFSDLSVLLNPYEYFEEIRAKGPVYQMKSQDILMVTGFEEAIQVLRNNQDFSSLNSTVGAAYPLPFEAQGSDISDQIEAHREEVPGHDLVVACDGNRHKAIRSLVNGLFTPKRLQANQQFMWDYADELVKDAVASGGCEIVNDIATPYVTLVVADLLGVPADDRDKFMEVIDAAPPAGNMEEEDEASGPSPLEFMGGFFYQYLQERREKPRNDILTELATATYPDGSLPEVIDLVKLATFMFGAGQDTSAKLLSNAMRYIVEVPGLQAQLRSDPDLIATLIEEVLRLEGSTKATFRLTRRDTRIGDVDVPAGKRILVALAAANRDPRRWENPNELRLDRPRLREHVAFGRGVHTCAGAPLARAEVRVILERFFEHTSHIDLSAERHGPAANRHLEYEPSFIIRGLANLYVDLKPA